jgi:NADH-quinone oxidoreductase subunit M
MAWIDMTLPILPILTFLPLAAGLLILALPAERKQTIRYIALGTSGMAFGIALWVFFGYDQTTAGYQFQSRLPWLPQWGISYHTGVDGMSAPLVLLAGIVMLAGVLISWNIDDRPREFFAFLFLLATGIFGVFVSLDLFQLFFFYELAIFPKYILILLWGAPKTREYGAMKLVLYLFLGSVLALVGALAMYFAAGLHSFDLLDLENAGFSILFQRIWFPVVFFGFAVLGGLFPFHNWAPDGHVAAPTTVSMILAGVMMKVGAFAALRVGVMLLPDGARFHAPWVILLALLSVVYGAFVTLAQKDLKYLVAFSSISHMGLVFMGMLTFTNQGVLGAGMQMFSHGIMKALLFACVGLVYDRTHTRQLPELGGLARKLPWVAVAFILGGLASMGMPGFSGFVAELPIFMGVWQAHIPDLTGYPSALAWFASVAQQPWYFPLLAILAAISIIVSAAYILIAVQKVFFGELPSAFESIRDISLPDKLAIGFLCVILIIVGLYPSILAPMMEAGVVPILKIVGGG